MPRTKPVAMLAACLLAGSTWAVAQSPKSSPGAVDQYGVAARYQKLEQFDLAAKEWEKLVRDHADDPLTAAGRHYAGVCEFQLRNYPDAINWFEEFAREHPQHKLLEPTLTNLGLAAYNQARAAEGDEATKFYDRAIAAFDKRGKQFPDGRMAAEADFYRAEALYALGKSKEAAVAYTEWIDQHGDNHPLVAKVRLALGATQTELGDTASAVATLTELIASNPADGIAGQALVQLGDAHNAAKNYPEAANQYAAAIDKHSEVIDRDYAIQGQLGALVNAGEYVGAASGYEKLGDLASAGKCHYQAGDFDKAADRLAKAFATNNQDADLAHWWVRSLLDGGSSEEALAAAERALTTASSPTVLLDKADAMYAIDGQRGESVAAYVAAANAADGELAAEARHLAAATALEVGDFAMAIKQANAVAQQHADSPFATDATVTLAEAQLQSGEPANAVATFSKLLGGADAQQRGDWVVRLAWAHSTAGDEPSVVNTLNPIIETLKDSNREQAQFLLGRACFRTGDHAAAIAQLDAIAKQEPPTAWTSEAQLLLARAQAAGGDDELAVALLTKLVDSDPRPQIAAQAFYRRGEFQQRLGNVIAALTDYAKVSKEWPEHPLAPYADYRFATLAMKENDLEAANAAFAKVSSQYPEHTLAGEAQLAQATCLARAGKNEQAIKVLDSMASDDPRVALAKGTSFAGAEQWDNAIRELQVAANASGEFADRDRALYELAWAYREEGKTAESRDAFTKLTSDMPDSLLAADAMFRLGESSYDAGDYAAAAVLFKQAEEAVEQDSRNAELQEKAMHMVGWSHHKQGDREAAARSFATQIAAHPTGPLAADGKWMIGESRFAGEQYSEAIAAYEAARDAEPTVESLAALGMLHAGQAAGQLGKWQDAVNWIGLAIDNYPTYEGRSELDCELGWALTKLGKPEEALPMLTNVADHDTTPVGARARFLVGELQFADKQYEDAVRSFFKVAYGYGDRDAPEAFHPWQAESLFEAARCLEQLDRTEPATKLYAELVERFPAEPKADLARKRLADLQ